MSWWIQVKIHVCVVMKIFLQQTTSFRWTKGYSCHWASIVWLCCQLWTNGNIHSWKLFGMSRFEKCHSLAFFYLSMILHDFECCYASILFLYPVVMWFWLSAFLFSEMFVKISMDMPPSSEWQDTFMLIFHTLLHH